MNFISNKKNDNVDTRSNIQLANLNSKPHSGKSIINIMYRVIGASFYPPLGSEHYKLI